MSDRLFLGLVGAQILHSSEEYAFGLYDSFPPARALSGLVSPDLRLGFAAINVSIILLAAASYWWPVRRHWSAAVPIMWFWVGLEMVNGVGHPLWSIIQAAYTPGLISALLLLPLALLLARALVKERGATIHEGRTTQEAKRA